MLDVLDRSHPRGTLLQNELRYNVLKMERELGSTISLLNFNRSFKRTVLEYSASHLRRLSLSKESPELTAGIAARFGMFQLVEKGYASMLPAGSACAVVVGPTSFSVLGELIDGTRVLLYSGEIEHIDVISNDEGAGVHVLTQIQRVPWALYAVERPAKLVVTSVSVPIRQLMALPETAAWEVGTEQCLKRRQNDFLFDR